MKRIAVFGAAALGVAQIASAAPMQAFDAATGQPVVVTVKQMTDAAAGVTPSAEPASAVAFEVAAPGYERVVVFQTRENLAGLSQRTIQLCRNGAVDTDADTMCDDAEAAYGTNPALADTDGDFLSDRAELLGWDGVDLAAEGVRPAALDVRLEIDFFPGFEPVQAGIDAVVKAFREAPTTNPDGTTGINLVVNLDDQVLPQDAKADLNPVFTDLAGLERKYRNNRGMGFWGVLANAYGGNGSSGIARGIPGDAFIVTLGRFQNRRGQIEQSGTIMHELGHNLGLRHGGGQSNKTNVPNFLSVMSYNWQLRGLIRDGQTGVLDYSDLTVAGVNESALNETAGFNGVGATTEQELSRYQIRTRRAAIPGRANENVDFNVDGRIAPSVAIDTDGSGQLDTFPTSTDEWRRQVRFDGGGTIGRGQPGMQPLIDAALAQGVTPAAEVTPCMSESDN